MAALVIPPDHIVCGHTWKQWTEHAKQYYSVVKNQVEVSYEEVVHFITLHEHERMASNHLTDQCLSLQEEQEIRIEEMEFIAFLKKSKPHLHAMYIDHLKKFQP